MNEWCCTVGCLAKTRPKQADVQGTVGPEKPLQDRTPATPPCPAVLATCLAGSTTASGNIPLVLYNVWRSQGFMGLFAGSLPRMTFISAGGFIFLGAYEKLRRTLL